MAILAAPALLMVGSSSVRADDLTGADQILCTAVQISVCSLDGECEEGPPWDYNIPQFIEIDLARKQLSTTKASGENRSTPIKNLLREDGKIFLQGIEKGRAFSFLIEESTGMATVAVARDGLTVSVFGSCTTIPSAK